MNGLYNGPHGNSKRARIPNYSNLQFSLCGLQSNQNCKFRLDMRQGLFETIYENGLFRVTQKIYPHRYFNRAIINQIKLERLNFTASNDISINLDILTGDVTTDLFLERNNSIIVKGKEFHKLFFTTRVVEDIKYQPESTKIFVAYQKLVSPSLQLLSNQLFNEYTHIVTISNKESDVVEELEAVLNSNNLVESHTGEWGKFWNQFDISVEGNAQLVSSL
jgi:trehalose/maltose hydrolase-like predicted phosphorylase